MTNLSADQLNALIQFVDENNQYNDDDDDPNGTYAFWVNVSNALQQDYRDNFETNT